eukprot:TRINITY_DN4154_c0_g1_i1.p1 TRINITY_DN4154_c0_g1~~TRINITY_DN4154_c0_g1_i1.p1  ORF type:complete len:238 (-),score=63.09 TRINITY_DN4154_c0_g1_i1:56-769(-)
MACFPFLKQHGADAFLQQVYSGWIVAPTTAGFHFAIRLDKQKLPGAPAEIARKVGLLKRNLLCAPLDDAVGKLLSGEAVTSEIGVIPYRDADSIFIQRSKDRVVVTFQLYFTEADDRALSHVFLQEFADANKVLKIAPPCQYKEEQRPAELAGVSGVKEGRNVSFLTFIFEKRHLDGDRREKALGLMVGFRNYVHYHLKCTKAYMHSRMRAKTEELLKVLRRAEPEKVAPKMKKPTK